MNGYGRNEKNGDELWCISTALHLTGVFCLFAVDTVDFSDDTSDGKTKPYMVLHLQNV